MTFTGYQALQYALNVYMFRKTNFDGKDSYLTTD